MPLQYIIQIIGKIDSKGKMTCWKIIQKVGSSVLVVFIQIRNIEKADKTVFFFISVGQNVIKLHLQMFKRNESAPE